MVEKNVTVDHSRDNFLWVFHIWNHRYEAVELRDGDKGTYLGNSVTRAVKNVNEKISEALIGMDPTLQSQIDQAMIDLDKTEKKVMISHFEFDCNTICFFDLTRGH